MKPFFSNSRQTIIVAAFLLPLGLGAGGFWYRMQAAEPAKGATAIAAKDKAVPDADAEKINSLLRERRDALREAAEYSRKLFQAGRVEFREVIRAEIEWHRAELDLATDRNERIAHCQQVIEDFRGLEANVAGRKASGQGTQIEVLQAKAARLHAEVDLLREQAKAR